MKATYDNLCSKKDFEFKSELCDLTLKFKETELKYNALVTENKTYTVTLMLLQLRRRKNAGNTTTVVVMMMKMILCQKKSAG